MNRHEFNLGLIGFDAAQQKSLEQQSIQNLMNSKIKKDDFLKQKISVGTAYYELLHTILSFNVNKLP